MRPIRTTLKELGVNWKRAKRWIISRIHNMLVKKTPRTPN